MSLYDYLVSNYHKLLPPKSPEEVEKVISELGVSLPEDYLRFLRYSSGGLLPGDTFLVAPLGNELGEEESLLKANKIRPPDFPLIIIGRDAFEDYGFLKRELAELEKNKKFIPALYRYLHETGEYERAADSFEDFIKSLLVKR